MEHKHAPPGKESSSQSQQETSLDFETLVDTIEDTAPDDEIIIASLTKLQEDLGRLHQGISDCREDIVHLHSRINEFQEQERVITDLSSRNQQLNEKFHEQETLMPIFNAVINIAQRCRQEITKLQFAQSKIKENKSIKLSRLFNYMIEARQADLIEVDNLLANFSVEPFTQPSDTFDPSTQRCVSQIECRTQEKQNRIARRILPGYRRNVVIVRREYVDVYIPTTSK